MHASETEVHTSNADESGQFMLVVYHDSHGITRTVAWRQDVGDTWSPEHLLFAVPATEVAS